MNNKYKTPAGTSTTEAINNIANELAAANEMLTTMFQMVMAEKAKSDARCAKYEAEEERRKAEEAKRQARYAAEEQAREEERKLENLQLHVGQKLEILELGKKDTGDVKVGDVLEVVNIDIDHYDPRITLALGEKQQVMSEDTIKRMFKRKWVKLV